MLNPGWVKAAASLAGLVLIILGFAGLVPGVSEVDHIVCYLAIIGGGILALDPLGDRGS